MADTAIEWATKAWNPTTGCDRIGPECDHCYAVPMSRRLQAMGTPEYARDGDPRTSGPGFGFAQHPQRLDMPRTWRGPQRVFVNSMSDLFHREAEAAFIDRVWQVMAECERHTFLVLTKRPKRMARYAQEKDEPGGCVYTGTLPNVWLGTSVGDATGELRLRWLAEVPSTNRWVSAEPLIGPPSPTLYLKLRDAGVRWVVIGGESGPGARPLDLLWARAWAAAADAAGAAVFVKQLGKVWAKANGGPPKGGDPALWPEDLRRRELPA
jgi:protein gp37